jgi:hypothetical protein
VIRLLFAAARGARIQRQHFKDHPNYWEAAGIVRLGDHDKIDSDYAWRIHPDDAHLQYGPISTALHDKAIDALAGTEFDWDVLPYMDVCPHIPEGEYWDWCDASELHRSLFLLILAEALADTGL